MDQSVCPVPAGGTGLLAIFVDLDIEDRPGFRQFLAEDMFPPRSEIGFGPQASYDRVEGDGQQFLTLYVAPSLGDLYGLAYQRLRSQRGARDALYHERFRNLDRYVAAWTGPEIPSLNPDRFASHLWIDRFDFADGEIQNFNSWFSGEYLPAMAELPGVVSVRRYVAVEGAPLNIVLHEIILDEFDDPATAQKGPWVDVHPSVRERTLGLYARKL